jgi:hypothetical protein
MRMNTTARWAAAALVCSGAAAATERAYPPAKVDFDAFKQLVAKVALPVRTVTPGVQMRVQEKPLMLALNVPTYITLYGYGYRNVYELDELVQVTDPRIRFEGNIVEPRVTPAAAPPDSAQQPPQGQ